MTVAVALGLAATAIGFAGRPGVVLPSAGLVLVIALLFLAAASAFHGQRERRGAALLVMGVLVAGGAFITLSPGGTAFVALLPVLLMAIVLPFVRFRTLAWIFVMSLGAGAAIVVANALWIPPARLPPGVDLAFRVTGYIALLALTLTLFYRHHRHLNKALGQARSESRALEQIREQLLSSNQALRSTRINLEKSNQSLQKTRRGLERSNRATMHFLNSAAHELRTPMTPILMHMDLIQRRPFLRDDANARASLEVIKRNLMRLKTQVDELVEVARLRAHQYTFPVKDVSLDAIIREADDTLRPIAKEKGIRLVLPETGIHVHANGDRITQVLFNLMMNAIEATPPGGTVRVSAMEQAEGCVVQVSDTGKGLEPEECEQVFEPFVQTSDSRPHAKSGLGLYISRSIVEGHGGTISCISPGPGRGTVFRFTLPLSVENDDAQGQQRSAPGHAQGATVR